MPHCSICSVGINVDKLIIDSFSGERAVWLSGVLAGVVIAGVGIITEC